MKTIVAGPRDYFNRAYVFGILDSHPEEITQVVSGTQKEVDKTGEAWADARGVPKKLYPTDKKTYGKQSFTIRNLAMAMYADALVAFWDGLSPGTKNMIGHAERCGLKITIYGLEPK